MSSVRTTATALGGEIIVAVVERGDQLIPVCRDEVALGLTIVGLLQVMRRSPAFRLDHDAIDRFLVALNVGQFENVHVVTLGGPKE